MTAAVRSLGARLRGQFLLLGVVPVLALFAAAWALLVPVLIDQAEARNRELALAVRGQVQLQLALRQRAAAVVADGLRNDPPAPAALERSLQALVRRDSFLQAAYVTDDHGRVVSAALSAANGRFAEDAVGLDLSAQTHVMQARQRQQAVWSDTFLSTLTGEVTSALAVPAGERMVLFELSLAALSKSVVELAQLGASDVVIVDRTGRVIAHPDERRALQQDNLSGLALVRDALSGQAGSAHTRGDGTERLAHALPVPPVGWAVVVSQPLFAVMSPVWRLGGAVLAVLAGTVLLAVFAGWRMARRTGNEVAQLADGAQRVVSAEGSPPDLDFSTSEFNAVWTRLRDLFQQLHQRDLLTRAARQDLQAVLDAATQVAIIATDLAGRVTVFNVGAQRMLGWRSADVLDTLTPMAWHDEAEVAARGRALSLECGQAVEGVEALLAVSRHSGYEVRDWVFVRQDGRRLDVSLAVTAMRTPEGELKGFLGVAIDITERRSAAALELARKTAELANQAKSDFLSKMSHELRTPLNAILGFAQLIEIDRAQPATASQRDHAGHIQRAGWHLVRLIDDVLDLASIESGRQGVTIAPVELEPLLADAVRMVQPQMDRHGVTLSVAPSGGALPRVAADATRLAQVLVNLLGNAAKYNRPQGTVRLSCEAQGTSVRITVADTGRGMSDEQMAHLYEPFNRLGQESSAIEGTGIGLVITRHLIDMMRGQLDVHSQPGVGTRFVVTLPVAALGSPTEQPAAGDAGPVATAPCRIVYIEDNDVNAQLMRAVMRQRPNIAIEVHALAASGLQSVRAEPPDLILLDMHLPDAIGEDVLAALQADPQLARIPVVVVSADATHGRAETMRQHGVRAYLTKPIAVNETLAVIDRLLAGDDARDAAPAAGA